MQSPIWLWMGVEGSVKAECVGFWRHAVFSDAPPIERKVCSMDGPMKEEKINQRRITPSRGYIVYDPELCTGCQTCEAICSFVKEGSIRPSLSRIQVHRNPFLGTVENFMPKPCLQCEIPQCMLACPVEGAMVVDEKTGARVIDATKCPEGCSICRQTCASYFDPPRILFHPDKKIHVKCDLCSGGPECVKWCPNGAIRFVSRTELVEGGGSYRRSFIEAFEKDFGPTYEPFEGPKWRYRGAWFKEQE
jgi:Fe-S-cluster-containing dehydrogenase component